MSTLVGTAHSQPSRGAYVAYGALGMPLAFAALPLYVQVPALYASEVGLSLSLIGWILLAARIVDAVTDPLIGWASDHLQSRRTLIIAALPLLAIGLPALLSPPANAGAVWFAGGLFIVSLGYSMASIAHQAWGAEFAHTPLLRTRAVASREAFGLAGVVLAAALPAALASSLGGQAQALSSLGWIFLPILMVCAAATLLLSPKSPSRIQQAVGFFGGQFGALRDPVFARLLSIFAANGIASAMAASTVLFYVADVLRAESWGGVFLALYFVAAAASLPLWSIVSNRIGKLRAWAVAMVLAILVFVWAAELGAGDLIAYAVICMLSGIALGADLSLPPSMLADALAKRADETGAASAGACFGWWAFVSKANLGLAAGIALPLLAALGYRPGANDEHAVQALALIYAGVPVMLKICALALLWHWRHFLENDSAQSIAATPQTNP